MDKLGDGRWELDIWHLTPALSPLLCNAEREEQFQLAGTLAPLVIGFGGIHGRWAGWRCGANTEALG